MELCEGSLATMVPEVKARHKIPGLPIVDVVALGIMLCCALDAVHRSARCLHLDVTPGNVLLTRPKRHAARAVGMAAQDSPTLRTVRLSDFGLAKRLPTSLRSSLTAGEHSLRVEGVAMGTPGYAPKEQLERQGQQRSDVYSMGATLLFAATGLHPFGGGGIMQVALELTKGGLRQHLLTRWHALLHLESVCSRRGALADTCLKRMHPRYSLHESG